MTNKREWGLTCNKNAWREPCRLTSDSASLSTISSAKRIGSCHREQLSGVESASFDINTQWPLHGDTRELGRVRLNASTN